MKILKSPRHLVRKTLVHVLRFFASFFFDKRYLRGRFFDERLGGWRWVWRSIWIQKIFGFNRHIPWPVSPLISISNPENIEFHVDNIDNFQTFGCYFQNFAARIVIGKGTYIAPNVGLITANHDPYDLSQYTSGEDILLGEGCWIGMNAVILPGVQLGAHTVVGAGAVVTKSFPEGNCTIAGVPAKIIASHQIKN